MNFDMMTLREMKEALENGDTTSVEIVKYYLNRIEKYDGEIKSYITINEHALEQAEAIDKMRAAEEELPEYAGIPIALKDLIIAQGMPTTCSSKILENFNSPYDATVTEHLKSKGFIFLGKLSMDEFAMGSSNETSYLKQTRNPWDTEKVPGGSSGGSAAAMAARLAPFTLGSDTGGSIRQPASLCGVTGLKPTYGRVSRFGLIAFASSLDQIGPITWNAQDAADLLTVIGHHDNRDTTSAPVDCKDYGKELTGDVKGMKLGVPEEYFGEGLQPEVKEAVEAAIKKYEKMGCEIVSIKMPHTDYAVATYYILATAEASSNLSRFDGVKYGYRCEKPEDLVDMYTRTRTEGFGEEVKRRIMLGSYVLSAGYYDAYYLKAQKVRTLIKQDFVNAFERVDAIICPTAPETAFKAGEKTDDPLTMYLSDIYTISLNLFGGCGLSMPCGFDNSGMPIGVQLLGNYFEEGKILNLAHAFQQETDFHKAMPASLKGGE